MQPIEQDLRVAFRRMRDVARRADLIRAWTARWADVQDPVALRRRRGPLVLAPFRVVEPECCTDDRIAS